MTYLSQQYMPYWVLRWCKWALPGQGKSCTKIYFLEGIWTPKTTKSLLLALSHHQSHHCWRTMYLLPPSPKARTTDTQRELFIKNLELLGLGRHFGLKFFEALGYFWLDYQASILVLWVPCPCFPIFNHYFYKKLSLYIQLPNIYLGLGFEFGSQRIRDLAFVCP